MQLPFREDVKSLAPSVPVMTSPQQAPLSHKIDSLQSQMQNLKHCFAQRQYSSVHP